MAALVWVVVPPCSRQIAIFELRGELSSAKQVSRGLVPDSVTPH